MRLPIESAHKTAGYLTLVPAHGRDYKSKREVMEAWDAGKDFIVQDMMSPYDGKPINKSDAKAGGISNVNIRYKRMRSVAVIKVAKTAFGEKMQSATEREYNTVLAHASQLQRPRYIDGGPRSMTVEHSDRGTLVASKTTIYSRGKVSQEMYMVNADYLPGGSMARQAKFPEGQKMTVEEVAEVVGPEFKEMNENPPDEVKKVREDMEEAMDADLLPVERFASEQEAEKLEAEAEANEAQADADREKADAARMKAAGLGEVAQTILNQMGGNRVLAMLGVKRLVDLRNGIGIGWPNRQRSKGNYVEIMLNGRDLYDMTFYNLSTRGKKKVKEFKDLYNDSLADTFEGQTGWYLRMASDKAAAGGLYGYAKGTQRDVEVTIRKAQRQASKLAKSLHGQDSQAMDFLRVHAKRANSKTARLLLALMNDYPQVDLLPIEQIKQAEDTPMGMYGYPSGTARLALDACSALRSGIGEVAYNLHSRRMAKHDRITGFLKDHSKAAKCGYTRLLLDTYPESPRLAAKTAGESEHYALTDVRTNDVDKVRIALEDAGYKVRPYQHKFSGHSVEMVEVEGDSAGIAKVMSPWIRKGDAQKVRGNVKDHFKTAGDVPDALKKHQFTKDDNPNPKGNDKDGDGKSGEKPDFLKEIEDKKDKKGKKASLRSAARRHFAGRRYDYGEVIDFLTDDKSTPELERMWKKWSAMVEDLHDRWFEGWAEANAPELLDESIDYAELAWKAFGSVTGMGIGLWEGDFLGDEHDEAFEKVVERDSKVSRFGQDLNDEITMVQEGEDEESMRMASRRKSASGNHHVAPNGDIFVDTAFLNATKRIPGVTLGHMGFGEFYADTPKGRVDFDRMRGKDFPGQSGRSHKLYGEGNAADWLLDQMTRKGQSVESGSRMAADQMLRKAFVPDSVDGWLEWEDGSRTATTRRRG